VIMDNDPTVKDWATQKAHDLVAKWEHGDAAHRQWLRDTAIPDLVVALREARAMANAPTA
jgi:hypothetical protein